VYVCEGYKSRVFDTFSLKSTMKVVFLIKSIYDHMMLLLKSVN